MKYTVKQFGKRLNGKFGCTGEISGLTRQNVISQIKGVIWLREHVAPEYYHGGDYIMITDESGNRVTEQEFSNEK